MPARVLQINVSNGGVPKRAVAEVHIGTNGLDGDAVNHPKVHGGPERAVCLFPVELIHQLQDEGHPIFPGAIGENLTTSGLMWDELAPDAILDIGEARIQLSTRVEPCNTIADSFKDGQFKRIQPKRVPGETRWYARVLREGTVRAGDEIAVASSTAA